MVVDRGAPGPWPGPDGQNGAVRGSAGAAGPARAVLAAAWAPAAGDGPAGVWTAPALPAAAVHGAPSVAAAGGAGSSGGAAPGCPACGGRLARRPWGWICPRCGFHPT
ncbi:hypothetical protein Tmar_1238 [Thermaerobacter marianensis DSM 12885]|uniref:Uncharacterized protein n=1 Tax=Thermaerobacter marianensis (strain ATCC 700841 / DSM 12885 / JCM 10246 / 7p75a) TaxID=644966 RepID=E6SLC0_THEM7|nr:hypothetical protein [Thermaerobacter marianensis]ADU51351.1 hypothetical protein Tmar_1238 [Thermaerobacter marianensis DSM 12885]